MRCQEGRNRLAATEVELQDSKDFIAGQVFGPSRNLSSGDWGGGLKSYASGPSAPTSSSNLSALLAAKLLARNIASARDSQNAESRRLY